VTDDADAPTEDTDAVDRPIDAADGDELDALVEGHDLVLVEFYTKGCAICQSIEPILTNVARVTDATVVTINPGDDLDLVDRFDVRGVPTLLLFEEGDLLARMASGFQETEAVVEFVESRGTTDAAA
jgi:thiol-disulfide isomerase/thioredoxin